MKLLVGTSNLVKAHARTGARRERARLAKALENRRVQGPRAITQREMKCPELLSRNPRSRRKFVPRHDLLARAKVDAALAKWHLRE
jgi:hypothetical protein